MNTQGVVEHLHKIVGDLYEFIINESRRLPVQTVPPIYRYVAEHNSYNALIRLIAEDDSLKKFFPVLGEIEVREHRIEFLKELESVVIWSDGSSEGVTPLTLCCGIIRWLFEVMWSWDDDVSLDSVLNQLPKIVEQARGLAKGRLVKVPAVVAIHNIHIDEDCAISIGSAVIRRPIQFDRSHLLGVRLGPDMDATLRLDIGFKRLHIRSVDKTGDREKEHQKTLRLIESRGYRSAENQARQVRDATDVARLAIILSSPKGQFYAPFQSWSSVINPLTSASGGSMGSLQPLRAPYPAQNINNSVKQQLDTFAKALEHSAVTLKTAMRRLLLAITERLYPEDALVDAIVSWEALFSGTPETILRVCGSMAKLLGPADVTGRQELYYKLRDIYLERNKVVHGAEGKPATVMAARDAAIQYALDAFQAILQRSDLLSARGSSERGLAALLGP